MEDIINLACEQALKKLQGQTAQKDDKYLKKTGSNIEQSCGVGAVEQTSCIKLSGHADQAHCNKDEGEGIEEEDDSENTLEVDPKLLLLPKVCTIKLDNMGLFIQNSFDFVDSKELIDLIHIKSNPLRKIIGKSEETVNVESIVIESSDDEDDYNKDNAGNEAKSDNNYDDDEELIENNISEAERVLLSSNLFKKPPIHNYNHLELLKNPDFEKSLKQLNNDVDALVNGSNHLIDDESNIQCIQDTNNSINQARRSNIPSATYISGTGNDDVSCNPHPESEEITVNSERNRAVNLPNITEVRRLNQKLLTAQVPPVRTQNNLVQTPRTSTDKPTITNYPKTTTIISNNHLEKPMTLTDNSFRKSPPPLIMFPQNFDSKPNNQDNYLPLPDNTTVEKSNTKSNVNLTARKVESNETQAVQCTCDAQELVTTPNGNIFLRNLKCKLHEDIKGKVNENESLNNGNQVTANFNNEYANERVLNAGQNLKVTSGSSAQCSTNMSQTIILPANAQLFLLPSGELAYAVGPNAGSNLLPDNSKGIAVEHDSTKQHKHTYPETKKCSESRFVFSVCDPNPSVLNPVPDRHNGVNMILNTKPLENSTKLATNTSIYQNEKRLCVSVDNNVNNECVPHINIHQTETPTHQLIPDGTGTDQRIRSVKPLGKLQAANSNANFTHRMTLSAGDLIPYDKQYISQANNATPKPMTIDLTEDDDNPTVEFIPIFPKKYAIDPMEKSQETKSLLIENQTEVSDTLPSVIGRRVAKPHCRVILAPKRKVQEQNSVYNYEVNDNKATYTAAESHHVVLADKSRAPTKKRNVVSAKLSNQQSSSKQSLLKPLDTVVKSGSDTIILKTIDDDLISTTNKKSTSGWVLMGL